MTKKQVPVPYDGRTRTVDELIDRLEALEVESQAIMDELRRQRDRARKAIEARSVV